MASGAAVSDKSKIEWTNSSWNPITGCTKVSPGCKNCYAESFAERWRGIPGHHFENGFDIQLRPDMLDIPLKWKKPRRVFVNSMSDVFHESIPDEFILKMFAVMAASGRHTYQVLTKRPERMQEFVTKLGKNIAPLEAAAREIGYTFKFKDHEGEEYKLLPWPIPNIWLGVSAENQATAMQRLPILIQTPAVIRFVSFEPLLGPIGFNWAMVPGIHWVIVGGESGLHCRPFDFDWAREIRDVSKSAKVAFFMKQRGGHPHKGGDLEDLPEDLRIREFPQ
jgi:protein gp37